MNQFRATLYCLFISISFTFAQAPQNNPIPPTPAQARMEAHQQRMNLKEKSLVNAIEFENVGPTVFSGRVVDVAVYEKDPSHFYVAYASGGLWKTESNGTSFTSLFDKEAVMTLGAVAVNWQDSVIWIGTGEVNSSRSSYSGVGIYKSTDGGKTWQHKGLGETHHIGRIVLHPNDPNTAWVAALGHLYSPNAERGIYKTTDGGDTWTKTLFVNDNSGAVDLILDAQNSNVLYAATWHRERRAWNFVESGEGSGIYKSTDGGDTWNKVSTKESGFPIGEGAGRIGISMHQTNGKTTLYAILDNYFRRPKKEEAKGDGLTKDALRAMTKTSFLALNDKKIGGYLKKNGFPEKYSVEKVRKMISSDEITPASLVEYLEDANSLLFDTPVIGAEIYRSDDEGKTWAKTHDDYLDNVYNSYGYYFGTIRVSPHSADKIYFAGVPVIRSEDGGKTFTNINKENVHVDHHALWANPNRDGHLILGNDGGINISYDDGESWIKCNVPPVGQFYAVAVDMAEPYNIYGGLQDNGVWVGSNQYQEGRRWHNTGQYPYKELIGGDGMQIAIDNRDNNTVYTGFQFGWYFRINKATGKRTLIKPKHELGERPLRFNWQTPIHLSIHNQDILYLGANKLYRSMKQGNDWSAISDDLTKGGQKGDVPYGTITTIDESPFQFGELYVGTDDGYIYRTKDGGTNWTRISDNLPQDLWVTTVYTSRHTKGVVYASLNGYRWDDYTAYLYKSTDYGDTWTKIGTDIPAEPINVVHEDPKNEQLIYVGTDHGLYVSLDGGISFMLMDNELPAVAVHDVVVHPRDNDLVVGTHGRSIYVANVEPLQAMTSDLLAKRLHVFDVSPQKYNGSQGKKPNIWVKSFDNEMEVVFYSNNTGRTEFSILGEDNLQLYQTSFNAKEGLNFQTYNFEVNSNAISKYQKSLQAQAEKGTTIKLKTADDGKHYLKKGSYTIRISQKGESVETKLVVE